MTLELAPQVRELELEVLPGLLGGDWADLARSCGGALVAAGPALDLPPAGRVGFDALLPILLERAVAAFVPLAVD